MTVVDSGAFVDVQLGRVDFSQLGEGTLTAPHLVDSEFLQSVRGLLLGREVSEDEAIRMIGSFGRLRIDRHAAQPLSGRVWELRHNLTAYEATYVALAEKLDTKLITTDARISRASGPRCEIEVV